jgi:hypothetical protein
MSVRGGRIGAALAIAALCALLACGESEPEPATPSATPEAPASEPTPPAPAPPPAEEPAPPAETPAPAATPATAPSPPAISLEELGHRIKETPAIGTFSKLALKNDIDDLVDDLRDYHARKEGDLAELHERYEALVLKLLTLLEEDEPELALALSRSRDEIWSRLCNPIEFAKLPT